MDPLTDLARFARHYPAWLDADGMPRSWKLWRIGMRGMEIDYSRTSLQLHNAVRTAMARTEAGGTTAAEDWREIHEEHAQHWA